MPPSTVRPSSSLRIAVLGAGNIGSAFAFQLVREGGHQVTMVARPGSKRLDQLRRDGAIIDVKGLRAEVSVTDRLDEHVPYDLVVVTVLAHQVDAVLPDLQRSAARSIQFMFNIFDPERLGDVVGAERAAFGIAFVQSTLTATGALKARIGAAGQKSLLDRKQTVELFNSAGLPAQHEPDMLSWLRSHAPLCVAFESASVAGQRREGGASWRECIALARGVHACFALIRALGFSVYPKAKQRIDKSPPFVFAAMLWFMSRVTSFRELLATGEVECRALADVMISAARATKAPIDVIRIESMKP